MGRFAAYAPWDARRVLRGVTLTSPIDRPRNPADNHRVRVGVAQGERIDWFAEWDGAGLSLMANTPLLLGGASLARTLPRASSVVVDVERRGHPASMRGTRVLLKVGHDFVAESPGVLAQDVRTALTAQADRQEVVQGYETVPLDLPADVPPFEGRAEHAAAVTISATVLTNANVSVLVVVPPGCVMKVKVDASCVFVSTSGAAGSLLYGDISDGATGYGQKQETAAPAAAFLFDELFVTHSQTINKTTTFTLRLGVDGGAATASVTQQTLTVLAVPV